MSLIIKRHAKEFDLRLIYVYGALKQVYGIVKSIFYRAYSDAMKKQDTFGNYCSYH